MITAAIVVAALIVGGLCGYFVFRYIINGKYKELMDISRHRFHRCRLRYQRASHR